jgi:anti-sigma B factor antagonist
MKITEQRQGAVSVIRPSGPLTAAEAPLLREHVGRELTGNLGRVVLDMTEIPYVDSAGLEALLEITERMGEGAQVLRICGANKTVREVLTLTDLAPLFDHFDDVTTAVRSFL